MVKDRETKMKETLKIIGLESWTYSLAMLAQQAIWMTIPTVTVVVAVKIFNKDYFDAKTLLALWILLWLFGLGLLAFTMFFQNFFSSPKLVSMVLPFAFFIPIGVSMTVVLAPILS